MLFFVHYGDKEYKVRVESRDQRTYVSFEDEPEQEVDLHYYGYDCTFLQESQVFHANVVGDKEDFTVWRPQGILNLRLESEYRRIVGLLRGQELGNENNVYAKMPGKIVKILAKLGDRAEKGQPLMVMEAMKMENEIRASATGTIQKILVNEGQAVETGALLAELEPSE